MDPERPPVPQRSLTTSIKRPARLIGVGVLALVLLIPLGFVQSIITERHQRYRTVVDDIANAWSGQQTLTGPILVVPFTEQFKITEEYVTNNGDKRSHERWESRSRRAIILPETLQVTGQMQPEIRSRGIYDVQVYNNQLEVTGSFAALQETLESFFDANRRYELHWPKAVLCIGLSEPKGIVGIEKLQAGEAGFDFMPGTELRDLIPHGFHATLDHAFNGEDFDFRIQFSVRGSDGFEFTPLGARTRVQISSPWPHPSFYGEILPASHDIDDSGFTAHWDISLLNRSYPQQWLEGENQRIDETSAGVRLFEPVALYDKITRSVKYGLLFIALTFLTLGLIEFVTKSRISLVQYLLVGAALALFFLILIALAEHLGFSAAYALSSAVVIVLNTAYCSAFLATKRLIVLVGSFLGATYTVLYTILVAEDFALLGGTVVLVIALATTMFFTRRLHDSPD